MSLTHSPKIITNGLRVAVDVRNLRCFPGSGNNIINLAGREELSGTTLATTVDSTAGRVINNNSTSAYDVSFSPLVNHEAWSMIWVAKSTGTPPSDYRSFMRLIEGNTSVGYFYTVDNRQTTNCYVLGYQKDEAVSSWLSHSFGTNQTLWLAGDWHWFGVTHNNKVFKAYRNGVLISTQTQALNVDTYGDLTTLQISTTSTSVNMGPIYFYDRVLGDEEMEQNFNAIRGRFGL